MDIEWGSGSLVPQKYHKHLSKIHNPFYKISNSIIFFNIFDLYVDIITTNK